MLSINTNLSSLITQHSMKSATNLLNQAVERMSTGYKVNHAKDNAAAYSIITNMDTKIGAYQVAEDNAMQAMDLVLTAEGNLDQIYDKLTRLRALAVQASNNTYGSQSLSAINSEANALVDEINRIYKTSEYSGIKLFNTNPEVITPFDTPTVKSTGFIADIESVDTTGLTRLSDVVDKTVALADGTYAIEDETDLLLLAEMTSSGLISVNDKFVLTKDIDLKSYCESNLGTGGWTPIGDTTNPFKGSFNGNGHTISNLIINREEANQALFGCIRGNGTTKIENLKLENVNIVGKARAAGLVAEVAQTYITNCTVSGEVTGENDVGGVIGYLQNNSMISGVSISDCHSNVNVKGTSTVGSFAGYLDNNVNISSCSAEGDVSGQGSLGGFAGGLSGYYISLSNSYATGDVTGTGTGVGGFVGIDRYAEITNCYATGNVIGDSKVGGVVGQLFNASVDRMTAKLINCYSTGDVTGLSTTNTETGGVVGEQTGDVINCSASGKVKGYSRVGGLVGFSADGCITNSSFSGVVDSTKNAGGILGWINAGRSDAIEISNCHVMSKSENINGVIYGASEAFNTSPVKIENCTYDSYYDEKGISISSSLNAQITNVVAADYLGHISFQVGCTSGESSQISLSMSFTLGDLPMLRNVGLSNDDYLSKIDELTQTVSAKQTEYGAVQNRLDSALEEISTQYENLVSSRSTLRDADIAEVSSHYIQQQILQQASATLMATANQAPAIALQLI